MVVVEQRDADLVAGLADLAEDLDVPQELLGAGAVLLHQVRDRDVLHADFLILGDGALDVGGELLERDVRGERDEADLVEHGLDLGGLQAVQAGELHAVVAHFLELLHRALEIALGVVADGINLHRYG
mgnify:CR=1 FL=1